MPYSSSILPETLDLRLLIIVVFVLCVGLISVVDEGSEDTELVTMEEYILFVVASIVSCGMLK